MVMIGYCTVRNAEPYIVTVKPWVWGDVREGGKDKFIWKFED